MPHFLATAVNVIPPTRSRTMAARSRFIGARPMRTPSSFALRMPAKTRSRIKSDSNSAIEPISVKKSRPHRPAGIHVLSPGDEDDAETVEFVHDLKEVLNVS